MKNVMTRAWEIAKAGVVKFGGKVKEYFSQALVMAWSEVEKGVKKVTRQEAVAAIFKEAEEIGKKFFTDYLDLMSDRKVSVSNKKSESATLKLPDGRVMDTFLSWNENTINNEVITFNVKIFGQNETVKLGKLSNKNFDFSIADYM